MYSISAFAKVWLLPPGCILLFCLIGFLLWSQRRKLGGAFFLAGFSLLWLLSLPSVSWLLINQLQNQYPALDADSMPYHLSSAIVVLGAGSNTNALEYKNQYTVSEPTLSRLNFAVYLYRKTRIPLLLSGGGDDPPNTTADQMYKILKENYQISNAWIENKSFNTAEESKFLLPLIKEHRIKVIYLVTHAWHMPRSIYAFADLGVKVIPAPMGYIALRSEDQFSSYLPSLSALRTSSQALHEYIGLLWYHFYYRKI